MGLSLIILSKDCHRNLTFWRDPWHGNRPPVANAGPDQVVDPDINGLATATLDASATVDPDGDTLDFWWMLENSVLAVGIQPMVQLFSGENGDFSGENGDMTRLFFFRSPRRSERMF